MRTQNFHTRELSRPAPPKAGLASTKFSSAFSVLRETFLFLVKEEENFVEASVLSHRRRLSANSPLGRLGRRGSRGGMPSRPRFISICACEL